MNNKPSIKLNRKLIRLFIRLKTFFASDKASFKSRIVVYFVFVILAFVLWFYRALDDTFIANISYSVRYQNLPQNKILLSTPPARVSLRVKGNGYTLISNKLKVKKPLDFNVNSFLLYSQTYDSMSVYILSRYAREDLTNELNSKNTDLEIVSIAPDSIFFSFARTKAKKVPVRPIIIDNGYMLAKQHTINGLVTCEPSHVELVGPSSIIDTIQFIETIEITPTELTDTLIKKVRLKQYSQVKIPVEKVSIKIPVDRFTEIGYEIPIRAKNVPDSINTKLFPRAAKVNFNVSLSYIDQISESDFKLYVDFKDIIDKSGQVTNRLHVKIDSTPSYIQSLRIYPSRVEYINELNNAGSRDNGRNR